MTDRSRLASVLLVLFLCAGCDAVPMSPAAESSSVIAPLVRAEAPRLTLEVPQDGATEADFVYSLASLSPRANFAERLWFADQTSAELSNVGTEGGIALALGLHGLVADSVTIEYFRDGKPVSAPITYRTSRSQRQRLGGLEATGLADSAYYAGTSDAEPTSFHYKVVNGYIIVVEDYDLTGPGATSGRAGQPDFSIDGVPFTTALGDRVAVTDVAFTLHGNFHGSTSRVVLESSSIFDLSWFHVQSGR